MIAFAWQTLLLLGLAYLLGCWIACLVRRMIGVSASTMPRVAVPAGGPPQPEAVIGDGVLPTPPLRAVVPPVQPVRDAFRRADTMEPSAGSAPIPKSPVPQSATPEAPRPQPSREPARPANVPAKPHPEGASDRFEKALSGPSSEAPAKSSVPAAPAVPKVVAPVIDETLPLRQPPAPPPPVAPSALPDDLKRIRTIDQGLEAALRQLGVTRFAQIGAWKAGDVARISQELGFKGRIEQENWIEQAQILASGKETDYSSRLGRDDRPAVPPPPDVTAQSKTPASAPPAVSPTSATVPVAPPRDSPSAGAASTSDRPPSTRTSVERAADAAAALAAAAAAAKASMMSPMAPELVHAPAVSDKAAFAAENRASNEPAAGPRAAVAARDDLQRIGGVTPEIEKLLQAQGVSRYSQVAQWSPAEIERYDGLLGHPGRIQRENWVEQAQILARGGDTVHSREFDRRNPSSDAASPRVAAVSRVQAPSAPVPTRPEAPPAPKPAEEAGRDREPRSGELAALRSVRSEGLRGPSGLTPIHPAPVNDLKRIRGIGVLIEKRLNSMGVTSYAQIAEWTVADIERVSHVLDFKGRIERENWVEQARILASGGQTEFSHRADRSESG